MPATAAPARTIALTVPVLAGQAVTTARVTITASEQRFADCARWMRDLDALMDGAHWSEVFGPDFDGARNSDAAIEAAEQYVADAFAALLSPR